MRFNIARDYSKRNVTFAFLLSRYPFLAFELQRQGKDKSILGTIK
jgi:hypothetical protein